MNLVIEDGHPIYESRNSNAIISKVRTSRYYQNIGNVNIEANTLVFGCTGTIIPNSVTAIGPCAFRNNTGINTITIPDSVTSIGNSAFRGCTGLYYVDMGSLESTKTIINNAFYGCTNLGFHDNTVYDIKICGNVGQEAFRDCTNLRSIVFGRNATTLGNLAFYNCINLFNKDNIPDAALIIPETLSSIGV